MNSFATRLEPGLTSNDWRLRHLLIVGTLLLFAASNVPADEPPEASWKGRVDSLVQPLIERRKTVGLVVGILRTNGKQEFYCYGETRVGGPVPTAETLFEIGSVTKPITALLLAQMVENGSMQLSDPVQKHLPPEFIIPRRGEQEISLLELATHTAGLPRNPPNQQRKVNEDAEVAKNPYGQYDAERLAAGLKELRLKEDKTPSFAYSNLGFGLLGEALAHRAGMTYGELVRTRIAEPLKLPDTTVNPSMEQLERMASGHSSQREPLPRWTFQTLHGCGAILSTPGDMLALQQAFCDRADTPLRPAMNLTIARQRAAFPGNNVGLSWFIRDIGERKVYWHNGGTTGFKMCNAFCQDPPVAVVILCNTGSDAQDDGREFYRLGDVFIRQLIAEDD